MERDAFLARVRVAAGRAELPEVPEDDPGLLVPALADVDLVSAFEGALARADGVLHESAAAETVVGLAVEHGTDRFLAWEADQLPVPGVVEALERAGVERTSAVVPDAARLEHQLGYMDIGLGVTGAEAGFAESGSIVLRSGPGRPRMASLIPAVHVALLRREHLYRSLAHWAGSGPPGLGDAANLVFVTGVSRTGDIEMRLNTGVHGPKHLHVILV